MFAPDSPLEGDGFELSVPGRAVRPFGPGEGAFQRSGVRPIGLGFREGSVERSAETTRDDPDGEYPKRNRWFESGSLQRGVNCEPEFRGPFGHVENTTVRISLPPAANQQRGIAGLFNAIDRVADATGAPIEEASIGSAAAVKNRFGPGGISERNPSAPSGLSPSQRRRSAIAGWRPSRVRRRRAARYDPSRNRDMGRSARSSTGTGAVAGNRKRLPATDVRQMKR